jgi:hypothetical protein
MILAMWAALDIRTKITSDQRSCKDQGRSQDALRISGKDPFARASAQALDAFTLQNDEIFFTMRVGRAGQGSNRFNAVSCPKNATKGAFYDLSRVATESLARNSFGREARLSHRLDGVEHEVH